MKKCEVINVPIGKKEVLFKDVSDEDIVNDFMEDYYTPINWEDEYTCVNDLKYFFEDYMDITEEDKERILNKIRTAARAKDNEIKSQEAKLLSNRNYILRFLDDYVEYIRNYEFERTKVGVYLDSEEILNLILKNGNKVIKIIKNES